MEERVVSSRSHHQHHHHSHHHHKQQNGTRSNNNNVVQNTIGRTVLPLDAATACDVFEHFIRANTLKTILGTYRNICDLLHLRPNVLPQFYPKLKSYLTSWKAKALWKKFDARANHKCYGGSYACPETRVLIIGAGPCGLRTAIDAQLLGAKVVVVEKRDRLSRNNVLHLWPFVIEDLRGLGAKKFFGKFCAGSIDHISIRQLQCILLKVALLLGVEVHTEVSFEKLVEPNESDKTGWRAEFKPIDHPVSQYEFDVIIGADGKRNTLQGFQRNELRGKLAIAITANFINHKTEIEARVEEISGVAYIFNQKFFKDLKAETGIDLENIVYYKDETHYFVMTARKQSLINKRVIKQDFMDTAKLLAPENVDREQLMSYAKEAAYFSTSYQLPELNFAVNYYGEPDVAMFDFTSIYAAENASRVIERHGYNLLMELVGDSLLEPFWPTGSGCARGFLSSMDACWAIRAWGSNLSNPLQVIAERESIYRLLAQTTPDKLNKDYKSYTVDPTTRYPNLNKNLLVAKQVIAHYDTDNPESIEEMLKSSESNNVDVDVFKSRQQRVHPVEIQRKRRRRDTNVDPTTLLNWVKDQVREYDLRVEDITSSFKDGRVLCAILHHYRPDLLDYNSLKVDDVEKNNLLAFDLLEKEIGIMPVLTGEEMALVEVPDYLTMLSYLTQIYDTFRVEIPHIKYPKLELPDMKISDRTPQKSYAKFNFPKAEHVKETHQSHQVLPVVPRSKRHVESVSNKISLNDSKRSKKRKPIEKIGATMAERHMRLEAIAANRVGRQNKRRQQRKLQTEQFLKSMQMLQATVHSPTPFEDYSIFLYRQNAPNFKDRVQDLEKKFSSLPDKDSQLPSQTRGGTDEDFAARIKEMEDKWTEPVHVEKKPKDLLRAIGKIETSDWNIKEIEKKINENKHGKVVNREKEKVPKWNREQFLARQTKMEKKAIIDRQESVEAKFTEFDKNVKQLDQKLKEGNIRELGQNKVASITEKLTSKIPENEPKPITKSNTKPAIPNQTNSEYCHFCKKRVYLMERLSAEGKFFHRGCFKCQYCHTSLRLGSYLFDKDGRYSNRFYCSQHFGMPGELFTTKIGRKISQKVVRENAPQLDKLQMPTSAAADVIGFDLLDRVKTPERIEFANLSTIGHVCSDHDESLSQMDEDEWTDRNFGTSAAEVSDEDSLSSERIFHKQKMNRLLKRVLWRINGLYRIDSESENDDAYEEALEEPATKEGTLRWVERCLKRYSRDIGDEDSVDEDDYSSSSDSSSYYENTSEDDEDTATEGEEEIIARQLRKQEVCLEPPVVQTDTGSETEIVSDESSSESSGKDRNSATEVSTDSEFALDEPTPTRERPPISFGEAKYKKRWARLHTNTHMSPKKVQVKSGILQAPSKSELEHANQINEKNKTLEFTPLVPSSTLIPSKVPPARSLLFPIRTEGYALNRTQSTGGIATKVSLELKKKYLLGDTIQPGSIQKSGSVSALDSKLKSFQTNISDCQKLLKPKQSVEIIPPQVNNSNNDKSCLSPIISQSSPIVEKPPDLVDVSIQPDVIGTNTNTSTSPSSSCRIEQQEEVKFEHELEGRPRSPVEDIPPIIVPQIDWSKKLNDAYKNESIDSSESDSVENGKENNKQIIVVPRLEIRDDRGKILHEQQESMMQDSLCCDVDEQQVTGKQQMKIKKTLNEPKTLPDIESNLVLSQIHDDSHDKNNGNGNKRTSICSTPSEHDSLMEQITAGAMTETELSDWARDGIVSDDLEDDFEFHLESTNFVTNRKKENKDEKFNFFDSLKNQSANNFEDSGSIEYMDNEADSISSDEEESKNQIKNNGYVHLLEEDDFALDSLNVRSSPSRKTNRTSIDYNSLSTLQNNTGYCLFGNENDDRNETNKNNRSNLQVNNNTTTTEENSCSNSTLKNITERELINDNKLDEEEYVVIKKETNGQSLEKKPPPPAPPPPIDVFIRNLQDEEYQEHCQRLQSKIDFGNVKDSIDVRKSKRREKNNDSIANVTEENRIEKKEEENKQQPQQQQQQQASSSFILQKTPATIYKKEEIRKERDENQKLVQEMVLNKMKAQNKSLERKRRSKTSSNPFQLSKSTTVGEMNKENAPDVLLSTIRTTPIISDASVEKTSNVVEQVQKTAEKMKEEARMRMKLKSNREFGLSPEEKLALIRQKHSRDRPISLVYTRKLNDYDYDYSDTIIRSRKCDPKSVTRTKSVSEISSKKKGQVSSSDSRIVDVEYELELEFDDGNNGMICRSDPNLLGNTNNTNNKNNNNNNNNNKANKRLERRKSITKLIYDFFNKRKDESKSPNNSKSFLSKLSTRSKEKSKSLTNLKRRLATEKNSEERTRSKSYSDVANTHNNRNNPTPPPIPPLPLNYTGCRSDESSDDEKDLKNASRSSCDTLDKWHEDRRSQRVRKVSKQAQLKRHRLAQEIQRKLEEVEVKTRQLEAAGVSIEKKLSGETTKNESDDDKDHLDDKINDSELLKEWFRLMRYLNELRKYEKELTIRAQELELEDRHARLQMELRERLQNDEHKTKEDLKTESSIINEMMDIVSKRDTIVSLLENEKLRYSEEDRDFEEQMLSKGLQLTSIQK